MRLAFGNYTLKAEKSFHCTLNSRNAKESLLLRIKLLLNNLEVFIIHPIHKSVDPSIAIH